MNNAVHVVAEVIKNVISAMEEVKKNVSSVLVQALKGAINVGENLSKIVTTAVEVERRKCVVKNAMEWGK
ncbi:MAG: hypothetical protein IJM84_06835 [Bacteroidaceae bacterium]|nr:hypothetical protein [Bacteroidaceae bacterium]MBQ9631190.1 hypothetical protein [Treponema sp.]